MSHIFLDRRDGRLALYLNGDLQFDAKDERIYHEALAFYPAGVTAGRFAGQGLRALILGGGDGLALREILRVPGFTRVDLVDRDAEVLRLGREELAELNGRAFDDPRAVVHCADARDFLGRAEDYHLLVFDLTYPKDVEGAALFSVDFFRQARAALAPGGILSVNAVSPEKTPQAFGCIGVTLQAAGFKTQPYSFELPSFAAEGYGRWGFVFASTRSICRQATGSRFLFPSSASEAMRVFPNRDGELLFYINNPEPIDWTGPFSPLRLCSRRGKSPSLRTSQGFADWLKTPKGGRSLEKLLRCIPLARRDQTRQLLMEWSQQAETLFRELDLRAFAAQLLAKGRELPRAWRRELERLMLRVEQGLPTLEELLQQSYRVFAILMLLLLMANIFFPDNLYAKGFSSHYGGGGGDFAFTSSSFHSPFRYHNYRSNYYHPWGQPRWTGASTPVDRTYDWQGAEYPAQNVLVADKDGHKQVDAPVLALSKDFQLLESGEIAYRPPVPVGGFNFLLSPERMRVMDVQGQPVMEFIAGEALRSDAQRQIAAQKPQIEKAMAQHRQWLDWVGWASLLGADEARSEMDHLEAMSKAAAAAENGWTTTARIAPGDFRYADWKEVFPGIRVEFTANGEPRRAAWVSVEGVWQEQAIDLKNPNSPVERVLVGILSPAISRPPNQRPSSPLPIPSPPLGSAPRFRK